MIARPRSPCKMCRPTFFVRARARARMRRSTACTRGNVQSSVTCQGSGNTGSNRHAWPPSSAKIQLLLLMRKARKPDCE